jgi:hypothetical protein
MVTYMQINCTVYLYIIKAGNSRSMACAAAAARRMAREKSAMPKLEA